MRGNTLNPYPTAHCRGIIPAYAGNTFRPCRHQPRHRGSVPAYAGTRISSFLGFRYEGIIPRSGEHLELLVKIGYQLGSSPRMRGTHANRLERCRILGSSRVCGEHCRHTGSARSCRGIIPAYAGNTFRPVRSAEHPWDHPRVCGEHAAVRNAPEYPSGSSPRMRGTLWQCWRCGWAGIIPAYAGNTNSVSHTLGTSGDHPRVCGEHSKSTNRDMYREGSSRVCGEHIMAFRFAVPNLGSSPRMRGTPLLSRSMVSKFRDHPRVCGTRGAQRGSIGRSGIIPAYAGNTVARQVANRLAGIIPAYAGNTPVADIDSIESQDHPRVCGEHVVTASGIARIRGSSRVCGEHISDRPWSCWVEDHPRVCGNTSTPSETPLPRDHPRVCGEHFPVAES